MVGGCVCRRNEGGGKETKTFVGKRSTTANRIKHSEWVNEGEERQKEGLSTNVFGQPKFHGRRLWNPIPDGASGVVSAGPINDTSTCPRIPFLCLFRCGLPNVNGQTGNARHLARRRLGSFSLPENSAPPCGTGHFCTPTNVTDTPRTFQAQTSNVSVTGEPQQRLDQ